MKAVQFEQFQGPLTLVDRPMPKPRPHGVVIKVSATGLCRSDWHGWQGHDPDIATFPHVPGHEFAGVVHEIGSLITKVKVGDRVTVPFVCGCSECADCLAGNAQVCRFQWQPGFSGPGSFAEYVAIPHADFNVVQLPDNINFDTAASLGCRFATSYRALVGVAGIKPQQSVAVFGCGGVGLAAIMIAKSLGARVIAIDPSHRALDFARLAGADARVDAQFDEVIKDVRSFGGTGVDVTVDAIGSIEVVHNAIASLRVQGTHVQIGLLPPEVIGDKSSVPMHLVIGRELTIHGSHGMAAVDYPDMLAQISKGYLRPELLVDRIISLANVPEALANLGTNPGITIIHP
ncbi:MAG: alcohol dehydrogenase catalytic domain-containing protein [Actinobacteria bacterium]|nr:alcohol dehydrogenase catalytic domain-containing protein [Actinomycetota bacterium]